MNKIHPEKGKIWLALGLALIMTLTLFTLVTLAKPPAAISAAGGRRVALVSTAAKCMTIPAGPDGSAPATVRLEWEGAIEKAYLQMAVTGSEGGHSIYINGQRVGSAPVRPQGQACQVGDAGQYWYTTDSITIPAEILNKGENTITLTNDADPNDGWTAANVHLEIHGILSGPPVASLEITPTPPSALEVGVQETISGTVVLTSSYEQALGNDISQMVWYQIPASYTGETPLPLLIAIHGMGGTGEWVRDFFAPEADDRGWLLAAPDMHGSYTTNHGRYALAWVGAQHDIIDTLDFMMTNFEVDRSRIYIVGGSMGGQTTAMMTGKYPDVFAAAVPWKPLTDLADWYGDLTGLGNPYNNLDRLREETGGTPSEVPLEYQRRSPMSLPQNSRLMPVKMWHDVDDQLVPIYHSRDWQSAINDNWNPPTAVTLIEIPSGELDCPPDYEGDFEHCYNPVPADVFDFLNGFTLAPSPPVSLAIRTDESKAYFWLNFAQSGGDHWAQVTAAYNLTDTTVTATISDTQPLNLGFNLGAAPIAGWVIERPGMGLPATTYLIMGGGNNHLETYTSGYLTATFASGGEFSLTISAIQVEVSSYPTVVVGYDTATSTITAVVQDQLGNPAPDGTTIVFAATAGTFPNAASTLTTTLASGQAVTTLTLNPGAPQVGITALVEMVSGTTTVETLYPALSLSVAAEPGVVHKAEMVTFTYHLTNTGDTSLAGITIADDNGTPGNGSDDVIVCQNITLQAGAVTSCQRDLAPTQTLTLTAIATGLDPLHNEVSGSDTATATVIPFRIYLPAIIKKG
ncbi:MAG: alpha/beta fold hydrolase [Chloroflexota bacterium]